MKTLLFIFSFLITMGAIAQRQTFHRTTPEGYQYAITYDPSKTDSTEGIVYMPGAGQAGMTYDPMRFESWGVHAYLKRGWSGRIPMGNGVHEPILITFVQPIVGQTQNTVKSVANSLLNLLYSHRIKRRSIHLMTMSNGSQWGMGIATWQEYPGDIRFRSLFASITVIQGMNPTEEKNWGPYRVPWIQAMGNIAKSFGVQFIGFEQTQDTRNTQLIAKNIEDSARTPYFFWTTFGGDGHELFDAVLDTAKRDFVIGGVDIQTRKPSNSGPYTRPFPLGANLWEMILRSGDTTMPGANRPPVAQPGNNATITLPTTSYQLSGSGSDPDGTISSYVWEKISGPTGSFSNANIANPIFNATGGAGTYVLQLTVRDNNNIPASATMSLTVEALAANRPPVARISAPAPIMSPANSVNVSATVTDDDGTVASYYWRKITEGTYNIVNPTSLSTAVTGLPVGQILIEFIVKDDDGDSTRQTVPIIVEELSSPSSETVVKVAFVGSIAQADNSVKSDPSWNIVNFNSTGAIKAPGFTSTTLNSSTGSSTSITFNLSQSGGISDNTSCAGNSNFATKQVINYTSFSSQTTRYLTINNLTPGKSYKLEFIGSRCTGTASTTTFTIGTESHSVNVNNNYSTVATFPIITPSTASIQVSVVKTVGTYSYVNGFILTELASQGSNLIPTADAGGDRFTKNTSFTITGSGADRDGTIASYSWTKISGPSVTTAGANTAELTVSNLRVDSSYVFELTVTDNGGAQSKDRMTLEVLPPGNSLPTAVAGRDSVISRNSINLVGSGRDKDGTIASYYWNLIKGPSGVTFENQTSSSTGVRGMYMVGIYEFELAVTDNNGGVGRDTVLVQVTQATSLVCKAEAGTDRVLEPGVSVVKLDGSKSVGAVTYKWRRLTAVTFQEHANIKNSTKAKPTVITLPPKEGGYDIELEITNGDGCSSRDTMNIMPLFGTFPPQSPDPNGWHYATPADTLKLNLSNPRSCRIGDIVVSGARANMIQGQYTAIALGSSLIVAPGKRVFIEAGKYSYITMKPNPGNMQGKPDSMIIVTNTGGQVEAAYMTLQECQNVKLTGKYVPGVSGHKDFVGHMNGRYAFSRGTYGIFLNNNWTSLASVGLKLDGETTDSIEVEYIEVGNGNFSNFQFKKDGRLRPMNYFIVHDVYGHDSHGEMFYLGSNASGFRHNMNFFKIYNVRAVNAGNEIFQFGNQGTGNRIYNNTFINSATNRKTAFNTNQDKGIQLAYRNGGNEFHSNAVVGAGVEPFALFTARDTATDPIQNGDSIKIYNNLLYGNYGRYFVVINSNPNGNTPANWIKMRLRKNIFGGADFRGNEIYAPSHVYSSNSNTLVYNLGPSTIYFDSTISDGSKSVFRTDPLIDTNVIRVEPVEYPQFVNSGWPAGFNYNDLTTYCDTLFKFWGDENVVSAANVLWGTPKFYDAGEYCLFQSKIYRSRISNNHGNIPQGFSDEFWEMQTWSYGGNIYTYPPEDYRLVKGSKYDNLGMGIRWTDTANVVQPEPQPNQAPTISKITPAITITEAPLLSVRLTVEADDYDGTVVSYRWIQTGGVGPVVIRSETSNSTLIDGLQARPDGQDNVLTFRVIVTDNSNATTEATVNVTVRPRPISQPQEDPVKANYMRRK